MTECPTTGKHRADITQTTEPIGRPLRPADTRDSRNTSTSSADTSTPNPQLPAVPGPHPLPGAELSPISPQRQSRPAGSRTHPAMDSRVNSHSTVHRPCQGGPSTFLTPHSL